MMLILVLSPETGCRCSRNGYATLFFLFHPVHGGSAVIDLAYSVVDACIEEDPLRRCRLAGIDVSHDAYVS